MLQVRLGSNITGMSMGKDLKGKNLGKGIRQNSNGTYEGRYTNRLGQRKSVYAASKAEIRQKLCDALKEESERKYVRKRLKLAEWYEIWMKEYKERTIRKNSKLKYEIAFKKHILPDLGFFYMDEIRAFHIRKLINKLEDEGYGWETQNKVKVLLVDLFNVAIENEYALVNPARGIRIKRKDKIERIVLTLDQQNAFFECAAGTFYNNLFVVAVNTGLRPGEICALTEDDLDFKNHSISVNKTLLYQTLDGDTKKTFHMDPPKTETSNRSMPMNDLCEAALRKQIVLKRIVEQKYPQKGSEFSSLLFTTKFNTPICTQILSDAIKRIINEVNLQVDETEKLPVFSAHTFRHTFATRCIEAGVAPKTLQKYLGHASINMTMDLYVHTTELFLNDELRKFDDYSKNRLDSEFGVKVG